MKLKLIEAVTAYTAILTIEKQTTDFKSAYAIMKLKNALAENVAFYEKEERKLIDEYADGVEDGGRYTVSAEKSGEFLGKRSELAEQEIEIDRERERITPPNEVSPAALPALGIVFDWEEA